MVEVACSAFPQLNHPIHLEGGAHPGEVLQDRSGGRIDIQADGVRGLPSGHHRGGDREVTQPGLAEDPITTWLTGVPATSRTGTTFPEEEGWAISGSRALRSILPATSYPA